MHKGKVHKAATMPGIITLNDYEYTDVINLLKLLVHPSLHFKHSSRTTPSNKWMAGRKEVLTLINHCSFVNSSASGCMSSLKTDDD